MENGGLMVVSWDFMGFYGIFNGFYGIYLLVNIPKEKKTIEHGPFCSGFI